MLRGRIVSLKQDSTHLHYRVTWPPATTGLLTPLASLPSARPSPLTGQDKDSDADEDDTPSLLHDYFALSHSLSSLYTQWAASDANFARRAPAFTGIRILNQDAWEALVAFICSSNNNISRISQMVLKLCTHYGPYIGTIEGEPFHDFPGPEALSGSPVEGHLRELGFGYRAKYIAETARILSTERPAGWLHRLRNPGCPAFGMQRGETEQRNEATSAEPASYRAAHDALLQLAGVGPKVADCVCLMGLGWGEAVPIDTHVWQIAQRDYNFGKGAKGKSFTRTMYDALGLHFRNLWGPQAGWAQSVLFTANLKSFAEQASALNSKVVGGEAEAEKLDITQSLARPDQGASRARKRKTREIRQISEAEGESCDVPRPEALARRTSKRRKAAAD